MLTCVRDRLPDEDLERLEFRLRFAARAILGTLWDLVEYGDDLKTGLVLDDHQLAEALTDMGLRFLGIEDSNRA